MSTELIINASLPETRIALLESGEIQDLVIERAKDKGIVGNIYKGRVTRVLPGMQAAFVDIGLEKAAFLYVDDVFVHSEIWEEEEGSAQNALADIPSETPQDASSTPPPLPESPETAEAEGTTEEATSEADDLADDHADEIMEDAEEDADEDDDESDPEPQDPVAMGPAPGEGGEGSDGGNNDQPADTIAPPPIEPTESAPAAAPTGEGQPRRDNYRGDRNRGRRGRRGGRFRRDRKKNTETAEAVPGNFQDQVMDEGDDFSSDRAALSSQGAPETDAQGDGNRDLAAAAPAATTGAQASISGSTMPTVTRQEFRAQRSRDRRIRSRQSRPPRVQANIQDLLKEGQEVMVQVAKDPISTKGARLTCHISLPGRHLVCMPTIDHVGVSRRIERDDERRRLRETVDRYRPKGLGFIVRTASGRQAQGEKRVKQDIDYLARLWDEIRQKAATVTSPALVYEDLNPVLRAIRDWVTEDIDKIIVDSRYHFNEIIRFVGHFMPSLRHKVELYHGDVPIFDAYNISNELSRALERKVWLKSGGYIVIDQAEALVAIDVNTGRFVGKKNLEDTILKTNLEAVQEIAYQLRLRNAGGIIILDFIDMEKEENRQRVYRALDEALKKDRARPTIMKISDLGLVEMTRKRTRDTMVRTLCEPCASCEGKGYIKSKSTVAYEICRELEREGMERGISKILVQAHPEVIDVLAVDEKETLDHLERRFHKQIYLQAVTDFHAEQFEVVGDKKPGSEKSRDQEFRDRSYRSERANRDRHRGSHRDERDNRDNRFGPRSQRNRSEGGQGGQETRIITPSPIIQPRQQPLPIQPPQVPAELLEEVQQNGQTPPVPGSSIEPVVDTISAEGGEVLVPPPVTSGTTQNDPTDSEISQTEGTQPLPHHDDEEDRLAYLRAQAAQDAALAKLGGAPPAVPGQPQRTGNGGGGSGGGRFGGRGGRNDNRRGGKRGRFNNRNRPRHFGKRDFNQAPGATPAAPSTIEPKANGNGGGGGGGNDSGPADTGGGGSDHSQPPV